MSRLRLAHLVADVDMAGDALVETLTGGPDPAAPKVALRIFGQGPGARRSPDVDTLAVTFATPALAAEVARALLAEAEAAMP